MLINNIRAKFIKHFGKAPQLMVRSPGRINLIGEHIDYNDGFVLPAAINKAVYLAISKRTDNQCHFVAHDLAESYSISINNLQKTTEHFWANYLMGVIFEMQQNDTANAKLKGVNIVFGSDIPMGGGMSSSAAIENGIALALNHLFDLGFSKLDLVFISQKAENNFVGINCGIMDMFASMMGKKNQFIKIDCRNYTYHYVPFNFEEYCFLLCDTGIKHSLVDSEYNQRRMECELGLRKIKELYPDITSFREVLPEVLIQNQSTLSQKVFNRCKYVIEEIYRVEKTCDFLQQNDLKNVGKLMYETHHGLANEYEVSCIELNFLVDAAKEEGIIGARMMGGGFGGCTINLIQKKDLEKHIKKLSESYFQNFKQPLTCYNIELAGGTSIIK